MTQMLFSPAATSSFFCILQIFSKNLSGLAAFANVLSRHFYFCPLSNPETSDLSFWYSSTLLPVSNFVLVICCCLTNHSKTSCYKVENVHWKESNVFYILYFDGMHEKLYLPAYTCPNDFSFSAYFYSEYNIPFHHSALGCLGH